MEFASPALAQAAERSLVKALDKAASRAELSARADGNRLVVVVAAPDFTALRARTTSALRDLRVISDAMALKEKEEKKKA